MTASTAPLFRQVNAHDGVIVPVPPELETCPGCKLKQARIAELETDLAKARSERELAAEGLVMTADYAQMNDSARLLAVAQAQAATALGSGNR
jgi:hypothetical protein